MTPVGFFFFSSNVINATLGINSDYSTSQFIFNLTVPIKTEETFPLIYIAIGAAAGGFVLVVLVVFAVRITWGRNKPKPGKDNQTDQRSDLLSMFFQENGLRKL